MATKATGTTFLRIRELSDNSHNSPNTPQEQAQTAYRIQLSSGSLSSELSLKIPLDEDDENEIRWLLEEYPQSPFSLIRASAATKALKWYARSLAGQLESVGMFKEICIDRSTSGTLQIQVEALADNSVEAPSRFQAIHWELLEELQLWRIPEFKFKAISVVRVAKLDKSTSDNAAVPIAPEQDAFRMLFVCARHCLDDSKDISTRFLMDPIFEIVEEAKSKHRVTSAEILRPGTWEAFVESLQGHGPNFFTVVHFDCHGWVSNGQAHLDFVKGSGETHSIPASEVAKRLVEAGVQLVNLNACSSAAASNGIESNLALLFAASGIPMTIAMSYNILDVASSLFESAFYRSWLLETTENAKKKSMLNSLSGSRGTALMQLPLVDLSVSQAVQRARGVLKDRDNRVGAGGWEVSLCDHIVPVVYISSSFAYPQKGEQPSPQPPNQIPKDEAAGRRKKWSHNIRTSISSMPLRLGFSPGAIAGNHSSPSERVKVASKIKKTNTTFSSLHPNGFRFKEIDPSIIGRDSTVAELEAAIDHPRRNVIFIEGNGGSGKSILARHMCDWWKSTSYVEDFFYFDCRKYAVLQEAHADPECKAERRPMMTTFQDYIFSILFPKEGLQGLLRSKSRTSDQTRRLRQELRSRRHLLVFDNASFPLQEKDGMLSPMVSLTTASGVICRNSLMASGSAVAELQSFIRDIYTGQCIILLTGRYKKWFLDYLPDVNALVYQLPKLTLSAALSIGENKLRSISAFEQVCNYPEATEDLASLVEFLHFNPLAVELVYSSMARERISPNTAYLKLCTEFLSIDLEDASMAFAGGGRFAAELKEMANSDWHDGADESRIPFAMLWMAENMGYLPTDDNGRFWSFVIGSLFKSWGTIAHLGLDLQGSREEVEKRIQVPVQTEEGYNELIHLLGIAPRAIELCRQMEQLGIVEQEETLEHQSNGKAKALELSALRFRVHPLFPIIARQSSFGSTIQKDIESFRKCRRELFIRYTLVRYNFKSYEQYLGGPQALVDLAAGRSDELSIDRAASSRLLETASQEIPSLIATLAWISQISVENLEAWQIWATLPNLLNHIISPLSNLWYRRRDIIYSFSEVLNELYQRFLHIMEVKPSLLCQGYASFTAQLALKLARMTSYRSGLPDCKTYLSQARNLISRLEQQQKTEEKLHWRLRLLLLELEALEATNLFDSGNREDASIRLKNLLTLNPPLGVPAQFLPLYLNPAFCGWLTTLKARKHDFPSQHMLLQMKKPILEVIQEHEVCDQEELESFSSPVQSLLRRTFYDLLNSGAVNPLPPRTKRFDTRFLELGGAMAGETFAVGIDTGVSTVTPGDTSEYAERVLLQGFVSQSTVAGSSGLAAMHMRISQYFIGCGQWREALRHLREYSKLPLPYEDRVNPGLRAQNSLMACLCFSKLHCYEQARGHAFKAIEEAIQAEDDGQSLTSSLGAFAGIEAGRVRRYSAMPKLLVLKLLDVIYSTSSPKKTDGHPSEFQLRNRKGDHLMLLVALAPQLYLSLVFQSLSERERQELTGRPFPAIGPYEERIDRLISMVDSDIRAKMEVARAGRLFWMDRNLEVALYTEAEHIVFAKEMPVVKYFIDSPWVQPLMEQRKLYPSIAPAFTVTELDLPSLRITLEISSDPPSFELPPRAPPTFRDVDTDSDSDSDGDSSSNSATEHEIAQGYKKTGMFGDRFMEFLIDRKLRKGAIPESAWLATQASLEEMEREHGLGGA